MVELAMNTPDWEQYGKDYYVSVRVGEVQRLSRMAASRTYKFPKSAVGTRRYGKVEIFRRVGAGAINIEKNGNADVAINMGGSSFVNFNVDVAQAEGGKSVNEKATDEAGVSEEVKEKARLAKEYLEAHQLEMRLSEAMQAVFRERPEDPGAFIAQRLAESAVLVEKLNQLKTVPPVAEPQKQPHAPPAAPEEPASPTVPKGQSFAPLDAPDAAGYEEAPASPLGPGSRKSPEVAQETAPPAGPEEPASPTVPKSQSFAPFDVPDAAAYEETPASPLGPGSRKSPGIGQETSPPAAPEEPASPTVPKRENFAAPEVTDAAAYEEAPASPAAPVSKKSSGAQWSPDSMANESGRTKAVPVEAKEGDKLKHVQSGQLGTMLKRTFTDALIRKEDGTEEWFGIEDLEQEEAAPKMLLQSNVILGPNFLTFGMRNSVFLL